MTDGLTNTSNLIVMIIFFSPLVYRVDLKDSKQEMNLCIRINGEGTENLIDRKEELTVFNKLDDF